MRELEHAIEMLVLFSDADEIGLEDLPRALRDDQDGWRRRRGAKPFAEAVEEYERTLLSEAIAAAGGVKAEAARSSASTRTRSSTSAGSIGLRS